MAHESATERDVDHDSFVLVQAGDVVNGDSQLDGDDALAVNGNPQFDGDDSVAVIALQGVRETSPWRSRFSSRHGHHWRQPRHGGAAAP